MTAWLVIAVDAHKRVGAGYDDDPSRHYSWDERVPNAAAVAEGDLIVLWDRKELLGLSVIEAIEMGRREKALTSCPRCGRADVAIRQRVPRYKCWKCKGEFEEPITKSVSVVTYRSRHEACWVDLRGRLSGAELRELCIKPRSQLSLRKLHWGAFRAAIEDDKRSPLKLLDRVQELLAGGHRQAIVRVRIGQRAFRWNLLGQFGSSCAFTGPGPEEALEAAHLYSYSLDGKHHNDGGLLLRRDLHRLFDLGLVAVNPNALTLDVSEELVRFPDYLSLQDRPLQVEITYGHRAWLAKHWAMHRS